MARPNQARLDLGALRHNLSVARKLAPNSKVLAVVKANGYGHGAVIIARQLEALADALAVASIEEAVELRDAGISAPILLLEGVFEAEELGTAAQLGFWITIDNEWQLRWLEEAVLPEPVHCWLKVDTGMHRLGIAPGRAQEFYQRLKATDNALDDLVIYTHFASADDLQSSQTKEQLELFDALCKPLPAQLSAANSSGLLAWPDACYDWVRPGYMLYGNSPLIEAHPNATALQPVMTLTSAVISLRDVPAGEAVGYGASWIARRPSRIATVTIGYGDGYPRLAANDTPVLINGQRASLAGRVSMDMITVDVTDLPDVHVGDEVVLWGRGLPMAEIARHAGTIGYELTTRMPARTPRVVIIA
ncbi:MAG: alanine racemase [Gammaproteobacteria bacterium]|nr:MAG: alanine racemase [Gammaproteobacteria bacterium]RLA62435.1 MAG: alanine racemase [Gammaproteobacteria bacterium]